MPVRKLLELLQADPLVLEEMESFALQNSWNPEEKNDFDKYIAQLQNIPEPTKLRALQALQPAFEPGRFILDHYDYLTAIILNPPDLESGAIATKLLASCFRTYVPPDPEFQITLTSAARKLLDTYVNETQHRWKTFEHIVAGQSIFEYNIPLDPNRIPKLEYVAFQYGMTNPLSFYNLLNELAVNVETRLHAFILLKQFLIVDDAPTYYLIDAELFGTVISSAFHDTDVCIFQTAITIITIFLPIVAVKSVSKLDDLLSILITAIRWEIWYPLVLKYASATFKEKDHTKEEEEYNMDRVLLNHSIGAIKTCVLQFYTVLYGMFPCNVLSCLSEYLSGKFNPPKKNENFQAAPDPLRKYLEAAKKSVQWDENQYISRRIEELVQSHKCCIKSILSTVDKERSEPWFLKQEPSEIIIECFQLYVKEFDTDIQLITKEFETLDEVSATVMRINTFLHGPIIQPDLEMKLETAINNLELATAKNKEFKEELERLQKKQVYFENESSIQIEKLKSEVESKSVQINALTNTNESLKVEIEELQTVNGSLQSYNPGLLANLQAHNEQLKSELESLTSHPTTPQIAVVDNVELKAQIHTLQNRLQQSTLEADKMNCKISELEQVERDFCTIKEEFTTCKQDLEQRSKENSDMALLFAEELKAQEARYETVKKIMLQYQCKLMSIPEPGKQ
ncbi:hypothetical protein HDV01_000627 [Terramyces sp. JEL0728]|nr:hypothetical protein HDV01_000627 [Terramyces sp. JEL0728]